MKGSLFRGSVLPLSPGVHPASHNDHGYPYTGAVSVCSRGTGEGGKEAEDYMKKSGDSSQNSEATMEERSTSNVQRRTSNKKPALFLHSTFDVER